MTKVRGVQSGRDEKRTSPCPVACRGYTFSLAPCSSVSPLVSPSPSTVGTERFDLSSVCWSEFVATLLTRVHDVVATPDLTNKEEAET